MWKIQWLLPHRKRFVGSSQNLNGNVVMSVRKQLAAVTVSSSSVCKL